MVACPLDGLKMFKRVVTFGAPATSLWLSCSASARNSREANWDDIAQGRLAGPAVMAVVAIREQRVTIYDAIGPILSAPVSTGRKDYATLKACVLLPEAQIRHTPPNARDCVP